MLVVGAWCWYRTKLFPLAILGRKRGGMMSANENREFGELDPNLPTIAAMAAAEIDTIQRRKKTKLLYLQKLADLLSVSITESCGDDQSQNTLRLLDPVSSGVISKAVTEYKASKPESYEEVKRISEDLAKEMHNVQDATDPQILDKIKIFCLAISRYALASRKTPNHKRISKYRRAYP